MQPDNEHWEERESGESSKSLKRRLVGLHKKIYNLDKAAEVLLDEFDKIQHMHESIGDNLKAGYGESLQYILTLCQDLGSSVEFLEQAVQQIEKNRGLRLVSPEES